MRKYFPKDYTRIMIVLPNYSTELSRNKSTQSYYNYMKNTEFAQMVFAFLLLLFSLFAIVVVTVFLKHNLTI